MMITVRQNMRSDKLVQCTEYEMQVRESNAGALCKVDTVGGEWRAELMN